MDSFEALLSVIAAHLDQPNTPFRDLAEILGQVKSPLATKDEIARAGLEVFKPSLLTKYLEEGKISSNTVDRVSFFHCITILF